jgi:prepilin-type N-terminal cleavage/methylation domain-containing protein
MKRKGFTLVELLVVIAIIALLMGILMPALAKVKQLAARMVCGSHLSGIGKAMMVYANDYGQEYPRSGYPSTQWLSRIPQWFGPSREEAYGTPPTGGKRTPATISSCFYLLVKYTDVTVKHFMCKGDYGVEPFEISELLMYGLTDYKEAWDFGQTGTAGSGLSPALHYSYSYHMPFAAYVTTGTGDYKLVSFAIQPSSNPSSPLCADSNPYLDWAATGNATLPEDVGYLDNPDQGVVAYWDLAEGYKDPERTANAASHQREGQNVLYNDSHVRFEEAPNVGIEHDNIWKYWTTATPTKKDRELGGVGIGVLGNPQVVGEKGPRCEADAYLVNETNKTKLSIK